MLLSFCAFNPSPSSTSMHTSDASAPNSSLRLFDTSFLHEAGSSYASPHRLFFGAETGRGSNADKAFIACPSSPCSPSAWRLWLLQRACHPCKPAVSAHWNNSPTNRGWGVRGEGGGGRWEGGGPLGHASQRLCFQLVPAHRPLLVVVRVVIACREMALSHKLQPQGQRGAGAHCCCRPQ
jgi:hypothetical protein